ncbi:hypothetical protein [Candidatus Mycoplasma haematohominis]|uniref:hypothetical protein n=1 Tax=Candidatus Mycoplasma haematohominis TaxID=1494318 RepID=UPI001C0A72AC|nr:hypothetical protein [Candidatus Mycoplasma haemohominis]
MNQTQEILGVLLTSSVATAATSITLLNKWPYLKLIEVHFYDQNKNTTEKIRLDIEDLSQISKAEFWKKAPAKTSTPSTENGEWKYIKYETDISEQEKYTALYEIARQYIQVQHKLNLIRVLSILENNSTTNVTIPNCSKGNKCCCTAKGGSCTPEKCATCLCCYVNNANNQCCCQNGNNCNFDDFKKVQISVSYWKGGGYSPHTNIYFNPIQVHIKLEDVEFAKLKPTNESGSSGSSGASTDQYKSFIGTMTYGFVDYQYKEVDYIDDIKNFINKQNPGISVQLLDPKTDNSKAYFSNIPNRFKFTLKTKSDAKTTNTTSEPEDHINKVFKALETTQDLKNKIDLLKNEANIDDCCCCDPASPGKNNLDCIIKRNYFFAEEKSNGLTNISKKIKEAEGCCSASPP